MGKFTVKVKWGKEVFKDVEVNTDEDPDAFRGQLYSLTGVPPEGQKIMCKGMTLKDTWEKFPIKNKASILLMGTAGELPDEPEDIQFADDLPATAVVNHYPAGLKNLGNTCYMNATLQCFRTADVLRDLIKGGAVRGAGGEATLVQHLQRMFTIMDNDKDRAGLDMALMAFLMTLRQVNPQFAEQEQGHPAQQDASEFWGVLTRALDRSLSASASHHYPRGGPISQYCGIDRRERLACEEAPEEDAAVSTSTALQLSCHIDKDIGYVMAGLKRALEEEITKASPTLGRDAVYKKQTFISRLPAFLTVNFVRFYFKRSTQENCKIRKDVKFPMNLDVFELCTDELKEKLRPARNRFAEYQDWEADNQASLAGKRSKEGEEDKEPEKEYHPTEFEDDPGSNNSGYYELRAVLTHRGRSSNSGHYVAWIKGSDGLWYCMDDDKVSPKKDQEILSLSGSGGADWHTAYILLYGPQRCPKIPPKDDAAMDTSEDANKEGDKTAAKAD